MIQVLPAIIPQNKEQLEEEIKKVSSFAESVQVDISDGLFTSVKTWPYNGRDTDFFSKLQTEEAGWPLWEKVEVEVHLMVKLPENVVSEWIHTGITSLVAHIEATENFQKIIDECKKFNVAVGLALKPSTDISRVAPFASQVDFLQVMGNDELGKHGVELSEKAVEKIKELRAAYPERIIGIDIGVNEDTAERLVEAGATKLISGSAILGAARPQEVFQYFQGLN